MNNLKLQASDIENFLDTGDLPNDLHQKLEGILTLFKEEGNSTFVISKVIIENDLETDDEDSDDE